MQKTDVRALLIVFMLSGCVTNSVNLPDDVEPCTNHHGIRSIRLFDREWVIVTCRDQSIKIIQATDDY